MDTDRFDQLTRVLRRARSRRGALAALLAGPLGMLGLAFADAEKRKGKRKGGNGSPPPPPPPCANGVKDGAESDVDCGGTCPRCANGKTCVNRDDCAGASCTLIGQCGSDANGLCFCDTPANGGPKVCDTSVATGSAVSSCAQCPGGTTCIELAPGTFGCFRPCGAS